MCGRYVNAAQREQIKNEFKVAAGNATEPQPKYNVAPSQLIETVLNREGERFFTQLKWGLVPSWAKDPVIGNRMINARAETIAEKPSFREAFRKRRCLVPATGFYEWQHSKGTAGGKQPFYFYLKNKEVFGFAGLYEEWLDKQTGEILETCTIITTAANETLKPVHDRMPVILHSKDYDQWLDEKLKDSDKLHKLLAPYPAAEMASYPVSKNINIPGTNSADLIAPLNSL